MTIPSNQELVSLLRPLEDAGWTWNLATGKLTPDLSNQRYSSNTIWHYGPELDFSCLLWMDVLFDLVFKKQYVPQHCLNCYKVVGKPETLIELHTLESFQQDAVGFGMSKCGIETRQYVPRLYGAYWYHRGVDDGLETLTTLRKRFPNIPFILKRGCTEFEHACGDSSKWRVTDEQIACEIYIRDHVNFDPWAKPPAGQPAPILDDLHWRWIRWAYAYGDSTYLHFTNGQPLHPEYKTYEPDLEVNSSDQALLPFNESGEKEGG